MKFKQLIEQVILENQQAISLLTEESISAFLGKDQQKNIVEMIKAAFPEIGKKPTTEQIIQFMESLMLAIDPTAKENSRSDKSVFFSFLMKKGIVQEVADFIEAKGTAELKRIFTKFMQAQRKYTPDQKNFLNKLEEAKNQNNVSPELIEAIDIISEIVKKIKNRPLFDPQSLNSLSDLITYTLALEQFTFFQKNSFENWKEEKKKFIKEKQVEVIGEEAGFTAYKILTFEASRFFGSASGLTPDGTEDGTTWCLSIPNRDVEFYKYKEDGKIIYFFINENKAKYFPPKNGFLEKYVVVADPKTATFINLVGHCFQDNQNHVVKVSEMKSKVPPSLIHKTFEDFLKEMSYKTSSTKTEDVITTPEATLKKIIKIQDLVVETTGFFDLYFDNIDHLEEVDKNNPLYLIKQPAKPPILIFSLIGRNYIVSGVDQSPALLTKAAITHYDLPASINKEILQLAEKTSKNTWITVFSKLGFTGKTTSSEKYQEVLEKLSEDKVCLDCLDSDNETILHKILWEIDSEDAGQKSFIISVIKLLKEKVDIEKIVDLKASPAKSGATALYLALMFPNYGKSTKDIVKTLLEVGANPWIAANKVFDYGKYIDPAKIKEMNQYLNMGNFSIDGLLKNSNELASVLFYANPILKHQCLTINDFFGRGHRGLFTSYDVEIAKIIQKALAKRVGDAQGADVPNTMGAIGQITGN